jgi:hypothetical protein
MNKFVIPAPISIRIDSSRNPGFSQVGDGLKPFPT